MTDEIKNNSFLAKLFEKSMYYYFIYFIFKKTQWQWHDLKVVDQVPRL